MPDQLELYAEMSYSRANETFSAPDAIEPLSLSADDPRNPFRHEAMPGFFGRSVTLISTRWICPTRRFARPATVFGLRGLPARRLHWSIDTYADVSRSTVDSYGTSLNELLRRWTVAREDAFTAMYDPLADHRTSPVAAGIRDRFLARHSWLDYRSRTFGAELRVGGVVALLPAGRPCDSKSAPNTNGAIARPANRSERAASSTMWSATRPVTPPGPGRRCRRTAAIGLVRSPRRSCRWCGKAGHSGTCTMPNSTSHHVWPGRMAGIPRRAT